MALMWWILTGCVALIIYIIGYRLLYASHRVWHHNGIKGPPPRPIGIEKFQSHITKKYGPVVGYYLGLMPFLTVTDTNMLKSILVKEFEAFTDRPYFPFLGRKSSAPCDLFFGEGEEWKSARQILTPSFSAAKMKAMVPLIQTRVDTLGEIIDKLADKQSVNVYRLYGNLTMDAILATGFGRNVDIQRGENNWIVDIAYMLFRSSSENYVFSHLIMIPLVASLPWIEPIIRFIARRTEVGKGMQEMDSIVTDIVRERRQNPNFQKYKDLLQLMINTKSQVSDGQKELTDEQIAVHSCFFLLAGYETTSTTLAYVSYLLALNPQIQEKQQQEIDAYFEENPGVALYDATHEIKYLDKVVMESLRVHPPVGNLARYCQKTTVIDGVTIPKGVTIDVPITLLHKNPEHWPNPDVFDPERFSPEEKAKRSPLSFLPFGYGPRNCIGIRLALLETKLVLIHLLRKFSFVQSPETEVPLKTSFGATIIPMNGLFLKIARKNI